MTSTSPAGGEAPASKGDPAPSPPDGTPAAPATPAQADAPDYRDLFLRATAELDNYRKRAERDRSAMVRFAAEGLARRLLDPVDSLDRAIRELERLQTQGPAAPASALAASAEGLRAVQRQFAEALASEGVEPFSPDGQAFDPALHEALVRVPHATAPEGTVVQVLQRGYTIRGRLLRPARVAVASGPPSAEAVEAASPHSHGARARDKGAASNAAAGQDKT